jgi:peptidoglycan/LPS O-acetylase OafA/YrhL
MIIVGVLLGVAVALIHNKENLQGRYPDRDVIRATVLSLLLIPNFVSGHLGNFIFPLNRVMWSLFFEMVANLVYATFARQMSKTVLAVASLAGLAGIVVIGPLGGPVTGDFLTGFPRVLFGFCAGALIYELWSENRLPKLSLGILPLAVAVLAIANYPIEVRGLAFIPVAALFAIVLILGANASPGPRERRLCSVLGRISYPIYLIHIPILYIAAGVAKDVLRSTPKGFVYVLVVAAVLVTCTVAAYLLNILYEIPVRRWLGSVLLKPRLAIREATS